MAGETFPTGPPFYVRGTTGGKITAPDGWCSLYTSPLVSVNHKPLSRIRFEFVCCLLSIRNQAPPPEPFVHDLGTNFDIPYQFGLFRANGAARFRVTTIPRPFVVDLRTVQMTRAVR